MTVTRSAPADGQVPPGKKPPGQDVPSERPGVPHRRHRSVPVLAASLLTAALVVSITAAAAVGSADIGAADVWGIVTSHLFPQVDPADVPAGRDAIVWDIRLPRALLAAVVGATLAVVGTSLQAVVRNPLADPAILGGASGAALGAVTVLLLGWTPFGTWSLVTAAFVGSLTGYLLAMALASRSGTLSPTRLVLAGVAVSYLLGAVANLMVAMADNPQKVRSVVFWQLGSLADAQWGTLTAPALLLAGGLVIMLLQARTLNALLAGDETAASLGLRPHRARRLLVILAALLTAAAVSLAGTIAFVGLVVPHAVRLVAGSDHARLLPLAALTGAVFLVVVDIVARTVMAPQEMPVGVITALIGAPLFCVLCRRQLREA